MFMKLRHGRVRAGCPWPSSLDSVVTDRRRALKGAFKGRGGSVGMAERTSAVSGS